jgi:hypothetical protein
MKGGKEREGFRARIRLKRAEVSVLVSRGVGQQQAHHRQRKRFSPTGSRFRPRVRVPVFPLRRPGWPAGPRNAPFNEPARQFPVNSTAPTPSVWAAIAIMGHAAMQRAVVPAPQVAREH